MNKTRLTWISAGVLVAILLSSCSGVLSALPQTAAQQAQPVIAQTTGNQKQTGESSTPLPENGLLAAYEGVLSDIYSAVSPSVVNIRVVQQVDSASFGGNLLPEIPFGTPGNPDSQTPQFSQGLGSGFVWDKEGHIVTNNHVVSDSDKIEVTFSDGTSYPAELVGSDPSSDLAVVKVNVPAEHLNPVQMADSHQVKVGQLAVAIGNPFGLEGTMTVGIISSLGRLLPASEGTQSGQSYSIPDVIQTDAPINPGNSGGVLLNASGAVVGVTSAIESPVRANAGVGFAIPAAIVTRVVPALIQNGSFEHPYLGLSGSALVPDLAAAMGLDSEQRGVLVGEVVADGPSDKAGLRGSERQAQIDGQDVPVGGDVITAIDGQPIQGMDDLIAYLSDSTAVGQKVNLTILRDGKEMDVEVTLTKRPGEVPQPAQQAQQPQPSQRVWLGISGQDLFSEIAQAMNLPADQQGVLVQSVQPGSPAEKTGLRSSNEAVDINGQSVAVGGDIIIAVNDQPVGSVEELVSMLQQYEAGEEVTLSILRDGTEIQLVATLTERPAS